MSAFRTLMRHLTVLVLAGAAGCSDLPDVVGPSDGPSGTLLDARTTSSAFSVYSQNVYLGGDTGPIFTLDFGNLPEVLAATNRFWNQVTTSDPRGRAASLVDQIDARRPHVVGLQEAFRFRVVDFSTGVPIVTDSVNLLASIEAEIQARGLPYEVVAVQENTTTGPASGLPLAVDPAAGSVVRVLQFTDRIAVLRRADVEVQGSAQGTFETSFAVGPLTLTRGWIRVSTEHEGIPQHFVTTHLETQGLAPVQAAQTDELIQTVVADLDGVTILAGDLNSDAANPGAPSWTPTYDRLIAAGFTDAWEQSGQPANEPGFTCCQAPDLRNDSPRLDERIDFVLMRSSRNPARSGYVPGSVMFETVADEPADRTKRTGLWPSDHAGLLAAFRLASGLPTADGG